MTRAFVLSAMMLALGTGVAAAQHHKPPEPPPSTTPEPTEPREEKESKPVKLFDADGACDGVMVYETSKVWRECCLLCSVGEDSPSKEELDEEAKDLGLGGTTVINQFFSIGSGYHKKAEAQAEGEDGQGKKGKAKAKAKPAPDSGESDSDGGLTGLTGLSSPRLGGFE